MYPHLSQPKKRYSPPPHTAPLLTTSVLPPSKQQQPKASEALEALAALTSDEPVAQAVIVAARTSMGMDISEVDFESIHNFAIRLKNLWDYRENLSVYLRERMNTCAPNLSALIGETVGARLISHAGSLTSLAKCPASTVQILGAEKALFRALKTKGNTPKYGLIFHSTFIGRASTKNKGRISRYLANKCAMACRIDAFSDTVTNLYGRRFNEQVEERLQFYDTGAPPRKNIDVMNAVLAEIEKDLGIESSETPSKKKKKKKDKKSSKKRDREEAPAAAVEEEAASAKKKKKKKKKKKE